MPGMNSLYFSRRFVAFLLLSLSAFVMFLTNPTFAQFSQTDDRLEIVDVPKGVQLTLPDSKWTFADKPGECVIANIPDRAGIRFKPVAGTRGLTLAEFTSRAPSTFSGTSQYRLIGSVQPIALNGVNEAHAMTTEDVVEGLYMRLIAYATPQGISGVTFFTAKNLAEKYRPILADVFKTLKITMPTPGAVGLRWHQNRYEFWAPNGSWSLNYKDRMADITLLDANQQPSAKVFLHATGHDKNSLEKAYAQHKDEVAKRYPGGTVMIADHQPFTLNGGTPALAYTYKDPATQTVFRDYVFNYNNSSHELNVKIRDSDFQMLKNDLKWIVDNLRLQ